MTREELAREVLKVLAMQAKYFRERTPQLLNECRDAERRLKATCEAVLSPPSPSLFDQPKE